MGGVGAAWKTWTQVQRRCNNDVVATPITSSPENPSVDGFGVWAGQLAPLASNPEFTCLPSGTCLHYSWHISVAWMGA